VNRRAGVCSREQEQHSHQPSPGEISFHNPLGSRVSTLHATNELSNRVARQEPHQSRQAEQENTKLSFIRTFPRSEEIV
jgi:hypothetical protein